MLKQARPTGALQAIASRPVPTSRPCIPEQPCSTAQCRPLKTPPLPKLRRRPAFFPAGILPSCQRFCRNVPRYPVFRLVLPRSGRSKLLSAAQQPPPFWMQSSSARAKETNGHALSTRDDLSSLERLRADKPCPRSSGGLPTKLRSTSVLLCEASRGNDGRHRPKVRGHDNMDCRCRVSYRDPHLHRVSPPTLPLSLFDLPRLTISYLARYGCKRTSPYSSTESFVSRY